MKKHKESFSDVVNKAISFDQTLLRAKGAPLELGGLRGGVLGGRNPYENFWDFLDGLILA